MIKKTFLTLSMVLLGLFAAVNTAWAINISGMTPAEAETGGFWARLTAKPATTTNGSGKVFVVSSDNYSADPSDGDYLAQSSDDGWSDIFLASSLIDADVEYRAYAKADDGSYFTGWSFTDGYTDLGTESNNFFIKVTPSNKKAHSNIREYFVYAAFMPVQLVSYEMISGSQEVTDDGAGNWKCTQTIKFRAETPGVWALSSAGDEKHFKRPVVTAKAGTAGTWAIGDAAWISSGAGQNVSLFGDYAELSVPVTFTAPNGNPGEYGAELVLETYAGVKMKVYLSARTLGATGEAIRYNKSKVQQEAGDLATLLTNAGEGDIIKLNGNYSSAVEISKNITFDLNGFTLSNTLTIPGGNVNLAYSPYGGAINNNVSVTGGKLTLTGGTITGNVNISAGATLEQNGAVITGMVTNAGTMTTTDGSITGQLASSGTLTLNGGTFTNTSGVAVNITGGTAQIKRGTISGSTYGVQSAGTTTIEKLAVVRGGTKALNGAGGTLTVNNGKFTDPADLSAGTVIFNAGYFLTNNAATATALGKQVWRNTAGPEFREGYEFFVGTQESAQASNVSVCRIGHAAYSSLEDALAYANNNPDKGAIIIMENDYTLKAGYYTLPSNATLIVPMSNDQETDNQIVPRETSGTPAPVSFRKLIFENGVNMEVAGILELTCTQYGKGETMGIPGGNYGHLILKPGSHMTINNGGYLRAWGFVTGDGTKDADGNYLSGEIDVRRGGSVHEMFQMGDWKGGDLSFTIAMEIPGMNPCWRDMTHLFPIYTYFIQNVESPVKYHPGSSLICATSVNVAGSINAFANDIKVVGKVGEPAMFLMDEKADAENTWVRKYYDAKYDKQVYEVNSGAQLGSMVIELGEVPAAMIKPGTPGTLNLVLDSRKFVLPLTNNFKIHLLSGNMQFTQSTSCLPGMEVEIDKESEISIINMNRADVVEGALYLYDADQWSFQNMQLGGYVGNSGKYGAIVRYSATWDLGTNGATKKPNVRDISSPAAIGDAILNVHGTFRMGANCSVYTTWSKDMTTFTIDDSGTGGAQIVSTNEDAGTFIYDADAPTFDGLHFDGDYNIIGFGPSVIVNYDHNDYSLGSQYPVQITTVMATSTYQPAFGFELCTPAKLQNGDGTFANTEGTEAGKSYCYMNDRWTLMDVAPENACFMKDNYGVFYAKPAEYVAVVASTREDVGNPGDYVLVGNEDHTYSDKAGAGRLFILTQGCQWWEVEKKDNLYHCIHPENDTYYEWVDDPDETDPYWGEWQEKRFTITWKNWDGTEIKSYTYDVVTNEPTEVTYSVTYGTMAEYLGSNPTREENIDYTYDFTGWTPELGPVTSDVTYTATYTEQPRKYTIIFCQEGGVEIERQFLMHNDMPECQNVPTRIGFTLQWEPALAAVTGDATYRATWLEEPPTEYEIRFVDYNGTTELQKNNVAVGEFPTPPANPSGKPATSEFTYVFDHWSPAITKVTQAMTYTAVYSEVNREYTISYYNESASAVVATESLPYGATPTPPTASKELPETGHTYTLVWKTLDGTSTIQTVMGDASYKPTYLDVLNKYAVTVKSNPSGACSFTGAGMYDYNTSATITLAVNSGYTFNGWSDGLEGTNTTRTITVTEDKELVANFIVADPDWTITWMNEDGTVNLVTPVGQKAGTATTYTGPTPTKPATAQYTYTFDGWATEANGEKVYKNGLTPVATANATYYAHFSSTVNTYKVTLASNPVGAATLSGAGTYEYNESATAVTIAVTNYNAMNYTFTGWSDANTDETRQMAITGDINMTANFAPRTYTILWKNEDGSATLETDGSQAYGTATAFNAAAPTKSGYTFDGWTTEANGEGALYIDGNTPAVTGDATYFAHFRVAAVTSTLEIAAGETVTLTETTNHANLVITSNGSTSGELIGANYLNLSGEAYFDLVMDMQAKTWYAVAVPWQVDATNGIIIGGVRQRLVTDIDVLYYDGAHRAANGTGTGINNWKYIADEGDKTMYPGTLYMIYMARPASTIRFQKKAGADLLTTALSVHEYVSTSGNGDVDAGWNGIANPAIYHAYANAGSKTYDDDFYGQKFNPSTKSYDHVPMNTTAMIVGEPIFVQVAADKNFDVRSKDAGWAAPRRSSKVDKARYEVYISAGEDYSDHVTLRTMEGKEDRYVIELDLAKAGVSNQVAQMWVDRYNAKLCVNTTAPIGKTATYPLGISIPRTDSYQIYSATDMQDGQELYVTRNGKAIWNLAYGPYTLDLNAGTYSEYGIKLIQSATTDIDQTGIDNRKSEIKKVLIDNKVYIVREGELYTITGQKVQ